MCYCVLQKLLLLSYVMSWPVEWSWLTQKLHSTALWGAVCVRIAQKRRYIKMTVGYAYFSRDFYIPLGIYIFLWGYLYSCGDIYIFLWGYIYIFLWGYIYSCGIYIPVGIYIFLWDIYIPVGYINSCGDIYIPVCCFRNL